MKKQKSFTLIELLVVIAIIGLLASIVFVNLAEARKLARDAKRKMDLTQIRRALELYYDKYEHYPRHPFNGDFRFGFARSVSSQPWIYDDANNDGNYDPGEGETSLAEFINPIPVDPINENPHNIWRCKHHYSYVTDADGQMYDLATLLETQDQHRCQNSCWKIYSVSDYEGEDYYWCTGCGGKTPCNKMECNTSCMFRIYADH